MKTMQSRRRRMGWALAGLLIAAALLAGCGGGEDVAAVAKQKGLLNFATEFVDATGVTPMAVAWDGHNYYSVSGGTTSGNRFARYRYDGTFEMAAAPGVDLRSLVSDNTGALYANEYGGNGGGGIGGNLYSFSKDGVATPLVVLSNGDFQAKAALNGDDSEVYLRSGTIITRYLRADGSVLGTITLAAMTPAESSVPNTLATTPDGRLYTYANGVVTEWSLTAARLRDIPVPIATPSAIDTDYSFSIANGLIWLYDATTAPGIWRGFAGL